MIDKKYDFSSAKIDNKQGNIVIGENNSTNNQVPFIPEDVVLHLLNQIDELSSIEKKERDNLKEAISSIMDQIKLEKPNHFSIKSMMKNLTDMINGIAHVPGLINAFNKWSEYIGGLLVS